MLDQVTRMIPVDEARAALVPPVRLLRQAAVAVARTVRHWEIELAGGDVDQHATADDEHHPDREARGGSDGPARSTDSADSPDSPDSPDSADRDAVVDLTTLASGDLPVEGWAELSFADAQARVSGLDAEALQMLAAYERSHGHRPLFVQLLEHRLAVLDLDVAGIDRDEAAESADVAQAPSI